MRRYLSIPREFVRQAHRYSRYWLPVVYALITGGSAFLVIENISINMAPPERLPRELVVPLPTLRSDDVSRLLQLGRQEIDREVGRRQRLEQLLRDEQSRRRSAEADLEDLQEDNRDLQRALGEHQVRMRQLESDRASTEQVLRAAQERIAELETPPVNTCIETAPYFRPQRAAASLGCTVEGYLNPRYLYGRLLYQRQVRRYGRLVQSTPIILAVAPAWIDRFSYNWALEECPIGQARSASTFSFFEFQLNGRSECIVTLVVTDRDGREPDQMVRLPFLSENLPERADAPQ